MRKLSLRQNAANLTINTAGYAIAGGAATIAAWWLRGIWRVVYKPLP